VDSGVYAGWNVPIDYDPMLSKLIVWAGNRDQAIERMLRALDEYHVGGIKSNIPLFRAILNDAAFRSGDLDTGYLDRLLARGIDFAPPVSSQAIAVAAAAASARIQPRAKADAGNMACPSRWLTEGRRSLLR
jgi:acetyl-CoA carboxylase biotin carboxylase subunit